MILDRDRRPFVDRPVTDGVAAAAVAREAARHWELAEPHLLRLGMNAIFRSGDVVLRVSAPTAPAGTSLRLADVLRTGGVSAPSPVRDDAFELDGLAVTAWRHLDAVETPVDWEAVGAAVRIVHEMEPSSLPRELPRPRPTEFAWWDFDRLLDDVGTRLDAAARSGIEAAIERHRGWDAFGDDDVVVCHGDVHPGNVVQTAEGAVLIDWDLLCLAPPGWDHGPLMTWTERWGGEPGIYERFAAGYGADLRRDRWAVGFAELRLVAATLMRVRASMRDEAAWPESDRRLSYWRGVADAPAWQAV